MDETMKPYVKAMVDSLSRQAGRDAVEVATEWYPEFGPTSPEWKATVFENIYNILRVNGAPATPENAKRAAQAFIANQECDQAAAEEANPSVPPAFVPKSKEVENDFYNDPNTSAEDIKRYLQAKHGAR
jgi:hypothetical protein